MRSIVGGALMVLLIVGFALVPGGNTLAADVDVHPMCWMGHCPDMSELEALSNEEFSDNTLGVAADVHPKCWLGHCPDMSEPVD